MMDSYERVHGIFTACEDKYLLPFREAILQTLNEIGGQAIQKE